MEDVVPAVKAGVANGLGDVIHFTVVVAISVREIIGEEAEIPGTALIAGDFDLSQIDDSPRRFRSPGRITRECVHYLVLGNIVWRRSKSSMYIH